MISLYTIIDNVSIEEVAESLLFMHEEILEGNFGIVELSWRPPAAHVGQDDSDDDED